MTPPSAHTDLLAAALACRETGEVACVRTRIATRGVARTRPGFHSARCDFAIHHRNIAGGILRDTAPSIRSQRFGEIGIAPTANDLINGHAAS